MSVKIVPAYGLPEEIGTLFSEYTDMLIKGDGSFKRYLEMQDYDGELQHPEAKYGLPDGRLYVAFYDKKPAGCIGLKKIDEKSCEMKRLFVRPQFRGKRIGSLLIERIIADARVIGYAHMLLDTLPFLQDAIRAYKKYGFYEIESYNDSPMNTSVFMKLDL